MTNRVWRDWVPGTVQALRTRGWSFDELMKVAGIPGGVLKYYWGPPSKPPKPPKPSTPGLDGWIELKTCPGCGALFDETPRKKYCSRGCKNRTNQKISYYRLKGQKVQKVQKESKTCPGCGSLFDEVPGKKYCSKRCKDKTNFRAWYLRKKVQEAQEVQKAEPQSHYSPDEDKLILEAKAERYRQLALQRGMT